jgi:hypothetical protein
MPVVDTVQTFNTGDTVTSTTLNNIMDQSIFVAGAVVSGSGLAITSGGQMTTSNIPGANITDGTIFQAKLASNVVGNGPVFRAYANVATSVPNAPSPFTLVTLGGETFDTNSNFDNNRFTPTVAGYYLFTGTVTFAAQIAGVLAAIYKNGAESAIGAPQASDSLRSTVTDIVYMNGSTDYVELRAYQTSGATRSTATGSTYLSGCLIRSA